MESILDIDQVGREVRKNMRGAYLFDGLRDATLFLFEPIPHQPWHDLRRRLWRNPIPQHVPGPDRLLSPGMRQTGYSGPAVQELWAVLPHHRADYGGVLQPPQPVREALPEHRSCSEVGGEPQERPSLSGIPPGVQAPLRLDQGWENHRGAIRRLAQSRQG